MKHGQVLDILFPLCTVVGNVNLMSTRIESYNQFTVTMISTLDACQAVTFHFIISLGHVIYCSPCQTGTREILETNSLI